MTLCGVEFDLPKSLKCEGIVVCNPLTVLVPSWVLSIEIYESDMSVHIEAKQKWRLVMSNIYPYDDLNERRELWEMLQQLIKDLQQELVRLWFTRFDI